MSRGGATSAPLIAPVDTITPLPLFYHVRTFYIVRYNSPTSHPSQPTYNINELQKRMRKRNKGKQNKTNPKKTQKKPKNTESIKQNKRYNLNHQLSPVRKLGIWNSRKKERQTRSNNNHSNFSIHSQHTNTSTSKQHMCVQGPWRECLRARHFHATLLLHLHLCAFPL